MKRKVRVKGPGVKLNNIWCYIDEVAVIDEAQYEENKEYVEVIEEIEENPNTKLKEENKILRNRITVLEKKWRDKK